MQRSVSRRWWADEIEGSIRRSSRRPRESEGEPDGAAEAVEVEDGPEDPLMTRSL